MNSRVSNATNVSYFLNFSLFLSQSGSSERQGEQTVPREVGPPRTQSAHDNGAPGADNSPSWNCWPIDLSFGLSTFLEFLPGRRLASCQLLIATLPIIFHISRVAMWSYLINAFCYFDRKIFQDYIN